MRNLLRVLIASGIVAAGVTTAWADEVQIRKNLPARLPKLPAIEEVLRTPIPGVYEVRFGTELIYTDERGDHVFQGKLLDTRSGVDLTEARIQKLTAIDFDKLPLQDAVLWKKGSGARRIAVFADPNCGFCKRFEQDLQKLDNVAVYTFIIPILGGDSAPKSRDIWCAKDPAKAWLGWMLDGTLPPRSAADCSTAAIDRNLALSRKHRVSGTPGIVFADGSRITGAIGVEQLEKHLTATRGAAAP